MPRIGVAVAAARGNDASAVVRLSQWVVVVCLGIRTPFNEWTTRPVHGEQHQQILCSSISVIVEVRHARRDGHAQLKFFEPHGAVAAVFAVGQGHDEITIHLLDGQVNQRLGLVADAVTVFIVEASAIAIVKLWGVCAVTVIGCVRVIVASGFDLNSLRPHLGRTHRLHRRQSLRGSCRRSPNHNRRNCMQPHRSRRSRSCRPKHRYSRRFRIRRTPRRRRHHLRRSHHN